MNNKILFLALNSKFSHSCLAIYYLRTVISQLDFQTKILELSINDNFNEIIKHIYKEKPDILALPVYIWNKSLIERIISDIKLILPDLLIVLGGPEVSYNSNYYLTTYPQIDYIITGPGEKGFYELAQSHFKENDRLIAKENYPFNDIPFPYIPDDYQALKNKYIYYESSRGCPFKCSYCLSSRSDQKLEYKDINKVKNELLLLLKSNPRIIKFVDRSFNVNQEFALEFWKFLIELNPSCRFHFEIHPMYISEEALQLLQNAQTGLFQFEIGVQSTNSQTLAEINRKSDWQDISDKLIKLLKLKNIHFHLDQIAGLPFEDYSSLKDSFNKIIGLKPDHYQTGILKVLYGTEMYERQEEYALEYSKSEPYRIYSGKWLSYPQLSEYESVDHAIDLIYNSKYFKHFLSYLFSIADDYYCFFLNLSKFFNKHNLAVNEKNFAHIFSLLAQFIATQNYKPAELELIMDFIRFDWALFNNTHFYPDALEASHCDEFKDKSWSEIKMHRNNEESLIGDKLFNLSDLRKARFFKCLSKDFFALANLTDYELHHRNQELDSLYEGIIVINKTRLLLW